MRTENMTFDQAALRILLSGGSEASRQRKLQALAAQARKVTHPECPNCGSTDCGDNGATGYQLSYCCNECGEQWDAYPERN